jgi:hypothetical protein
MWIYYHLTGECPYTWVRPYSESEHRKCKIRQNRNFTITQLIRVIYVLVLTRQKYFLFFLKAVFRLWDIPVHAEWLCKQTQTRCTFSYFMRGNQMELWPLWRGGSSSPVKYHKHVTRRRDSWLESQGSRNRSGSHSFAAVEKNSATKATTGKSKGQFLIVCFFSFFI